MTAVIERTMRRQMGRAARSYSAEELMILFFSFAALGWLWEVGLHIVFDGEIVNRGTMLGPWLPIYGVGGVLSARLFSRLAERPGTVFLLSAALCASIEYTASVYLEAMYGLRWWDYSRYLFNLDGRVCLEMTVLFGIGCCAAIYAAAPAIAERAGRARPAARRAVCTVLVILFACDFVCSAVKPNMGPGVTHGVADTSHVRMINPARAAGLTLRPGAAIQAAQP